MERKGIVHPTLRLIRSTAVLVSVAVVLMALVAAMLFQDLSSRRPAWQAEVPTPTRAQINAAVARLISAGRSAELYSFYAQEVGDPTRAMLYTASALITGAPVDLVIAKDWWEGGHQVGTLTGPNLNGSYDVNPAGLNTYTYKAYTLAELKQVQLNISQGVEGLAEQRARWGVSWEAALGAYNHGSPSGLDQRQIDYVTAVLRHEWELDRRFAARFPDAL